MSERIVQKLKTGELTPDQAIQEFEKDPTRKVTDIPLNKLAVDTLDCGFPSLNEADFLKRGEGELISVGARPGMGKSAFIFQIGQYVSQTQHVLMFSAEMSLRAITQRMVAQKTGLGLKKVKHGIGPKEIYERAYRELDALKLCVDARTGLDIQTLKQVARQKHKQSRLGLIVVDYTQIIGNRTRIDNRSLELGTIAKGLREIASELECPVISGAQVNRECIRRGYEMMREGEEPDFMPALGETAQSDRIEEHADVVIAISREEPITGKKPGLAEIQLLKNRSGELGRFTFKFLGASTRFVDPKVSSYEPSSSTEDLV